MKNDDVRKLRRRVDMETIKLFSYQDVKKLLCPHCAAGVPGYIEAAPNHTLTWRHCPLDKKFEPYDPVCGANVFAQRATFDFMEEVYDKRYNRTTNRNVTGAIDSNVSRGNGKVSSTSTGQTGKDF